MLNLDEKALLFLADLAANNNREWFHENKQRYERDLKNPWKQFIDSVLVELADVHADFHGIASKNCIFRIHRDTRFSPDKSPYKLNISAGISSGGKSSSSPGVYLQASPEGWWIGGGAYWLSKEDLLAVRMHIVAHPQEWRKVVDDSDFQKLFGGVQGQRNKRLTGELGEEANEIPDLYLKQFYYMAQLPAEEILSQNALNILKRHVLAAEPVRLFLRDALESN